MSQQQTTIRQNMEDNESDRPSGSGPYQNLSVSGRRKRKSASAFRTISEVAKKLGVQQHVLRFWETKFSQIRPLKRGGGRRYYRPEDIELLQTIHHLLYTEGYTIKGVQKLLKEQGKNKLVEATIDEAGLPPLRKPVETVQETKAPEEETSAETLNPRQKEQIRLVLSELKQLRDTMRGE